MLRRVLVGVGSLHAVAAAPLRRGAARMSSGSAIGLRVDHAQVALRSADAVCFDVDSTVIRVEGIDELAAYLGVGDKVAALTAAAMGGDVPFHEVRTNPARSLSHARYMCACAPFASADTPPFPHMSHPVSPICQKSILLFRRSRSRRCPSSQRALERRRGYPSGSFPWCPSRASSLPSSMLACRSDGLSDGKRTSRWRRRPAATEPVGCAKPSGPALGFL